MLSITHLRPGSYISMDNDPYVVTWSQHSKQARGAGVMKTKMRNLRTGKTVDRTFQGNEKVEEASIKYARAQYLYKNGDMYEFMDQTSFDTVTLSHDVLGDAQHFLVEGEELDIQYYDEHPINIQLPPKMTFEITDTEPGVKGDTAGTANKLATISTGYSVKVPLFINKGDSIVVNTLTGEYTERAK